MERRVLPACEVREVDGRVMLTGRAIAFNSWSEPLGSGRYKFREQVAPGSFSTSDTDLRMLVDHDTGKVLGRMGAGTLRCVMDSRGMTFECDPPDTSYGLDIVKSIRRGDVAGMSFGFDTVEDDWDEVDGQTRRTLRRIKVYEISALTFPAYTDTEVAVRALTARGEAMALMRRRRLRLAGQR